MLTGGGLKLPANRAILKQDWKALGLSSHVQLSVFLVRVNQAKTCHLIQRRCAMTATKRYCVREAMEFPVDQFYQDPDGVWVHKAGKKWHYADTGELINPSPQPGTTLGVDLGLDKKPPQGGEL
jgi:hypothetical protein